MRALASFLLSLIQLFDLVDLGLGSRPGIGSQPVIDELSPQHRADDLRPHRHHLGIVALARPFGRIGVVTDRRAHARILSATMAMPMPVPQIRMPRENSPRAISLETAIATSG